MSVMSKILSNETGLGVVVVVDVVVDVVVVVGVVCLFFVSFCRKKGRPKHGTFRCW